VSSVSQTRDGSRVVRASLYALLANVQASCTHVEVRSSAMLWPTPHSFQSHSLITLLHWRRFRSSPAAVNHMHHGETETIQSCTRWTQYRRAVFTCGVEREAEERHPHHHQPEHRLGEARQGLGRVYQAGLGDLIQLAALQDRLCARSWDISCQQAAADLSRSH
jgi:hypothetical protein